MAKKAKLRPTKKVIRELFPPAIVRELDRIVNDVDNPKLKNPKGSRAAKPWGGKWVKERNE